MSTRNVRLFIQLAAVAALSASAAMAQATCTIVPGSSVGSYANYSYTNNAMTGTVLYRLGTFPAGTTVIVGTVGLIGASTATDTFLRLFDQFGEVAYNDDACYNQGSFYGSRVVYTVPQGWRTLTVRAGCYSNTTCGGTVKMWTRLDSNGYLSDVIGKGYNQIQTTGSQLMATAVNNNGIIHNSYTYCGPLQNCYVHFQGIQRLYRPYNVGNSNWFVLSGSSTADLMFGYLGGHLASAMNQTWQESGGYSGGIGGSIYSTRSFWEVIAPTSFNGYHFGGIQQNGNYLIAGLQKYDGAGDVDVGRVMLFNISDPSASAATMKKVDFSQFDTALRAATDAGMTKHRDGTILLAVGRHDENALIFYKKNADEYSSCLTTSLAYPAHTSCVGANTGCPSDCGKQVGFADIESPTGWYYQRTISSVPAFKNVNMFTQVNGAIYIIASTQNHSKYGFLDSWSLTVSGWSNAKTGYGCAQTGYCDFAGASGFYADALSDRMYLYSASKYMGEYTPTGTVGVSEFGTSLPIPSPLP